MINLLGDRYGKLTVIASIPKSDWDNPKRASWLVQCDCGSEPFIVNSNNLRRGCTKHCGCVKFIREIHPAFKHGMSHTPEYKAWSSMIQRCTNPRAQGFEQYGGRGIRVCDEWLKDFRNFYEDVGPKPHPDLSLDRLNVDGDYEPGNVIWSDQSWQTKNQRRYLKYRKNYEYERRRENAINS